MLGAALRSQSRSAPKGSKDGILSQLSAAQEGLGACLGQWGRARKGWRLNRACPSVQEGIQEGTPPWRFERREDGDGSGALRALSQPRLSAGLRLSLSNSDLFLLLLTPPFSADTTERRSRRVPSAKRGVLCRAARQKNCLKMGLKWLYFLLSWLVNLPGIYFLSTSEICCIRATVETVKIISQCYLCWEVGVILHCLR